MVLNTTPTGSVFQFFSERFFAGGNNLLALDISHTLNLTKSQHASPRFYIEIISQYH